ncbi:MAG: hypothetical protein WD273_14020, partial [Trueperaceae bacterium]
MWKNLLLALVVLLFVGVTRGQTVEFSAAYPAFDEGNRRLELFFADFPVDQGTAGLRLAAGDELELGLRLRQAGSVATVGNLITTLAADGSTAGRYSLAFTARGVLGPAALRLRASVYDGSAPLAPLAEGALPDLPQLGPGVAVVGLEAGVSYRLSRSLIVDIGPGLFLREGRLGGRLEGEARLLRAVGGDDLSLLVHVFAEPRFTRRSAAVGVGYSWNRRRAPSWDASVWLGWGPGGVAPGARLEGSEPLAHGRLDLLLAAEPYRLD